MKKIILAFLLGSNLLYADAKQSTNKLYKLLDKIIDRIEVLVDEDLTNDRNERKEDAGYRDNKEADRSGNEEQNRKED